jgi:hypothetical protein
MAISESPGRFDRHTSGRYLNRQSHGKLQLHSYTFDNSETRTRARTGMLFQKSVS